MLGANLAILSLVIHFFKAFSISRVLSTTKFILWLTGSILFLLSLGVAFTGYVIVSGNMSFWAALVILNLLSVIPFIGNELVNGILSGGTMNSWSVRRFTVIHFLLAIIAILILIIHLILLHRGQPRKFNSNIADSRETLMFVLIKDFAIVLLFIGILFTNLIFELIHPDNWQSFSRLTTPSHIEPEIYFLWTFAIIKLHASKLLGLLF